DILSKISFGSMCFALIIGAVIILGSMWKARRPVYAEESA
ncbi:MAG: sulfite exporter TauE/SafE family protein, partial [Deltaproteobacteria bacterium]